MASKPDTIAQLLGAANAAHKNGDAVLAERTLAQAKKLAPNDPRVHNALGMAALAAGDNLAARDHFTSATLADPVAIPLFVNLATAYRALADDAGEERALLAAADINQREFMPQLRLAELYQRSGQGREAALRWRNVVQMTMGAQNLPPMVAEAVQRGNTYLAEHYAQLQSQVDGVLGERIASLGCLHGTAMHEVSHETTKRIQHHSDRPSLGHRRSDPVQLSLQRGNGGCARCSA